MASRNRRKTASPLVQFKNQIRGGHVDVLTALAQSRGALSPSDYNAALAWLATVPAGRAVFRAAFPASTNEVKLGAPPRSIGLARELAWGAAVVRTHARRLNDYFPLRRDFEVALLASDYVACLTILNEMDTQFGVSLFSIDQRIAILQVVSGLQAQKSYANRVVASRPPNDVVAFLAFYASERNEENTTASRFSARINSLLNEAGFQDGLSAYLCFRLLGEKPANDGAIDGVLRFELTSPIIDYYETYVRVLVQLAGGPTPTLPLSHLSTLSSMLDDDRLNRATSIHDGTLPNVEDDMVAWSKLLTGRWDEAHALVAPRAASASRSAWAVQVISVALGNVLLPDTRTLAGFIVKSMASIVTREDDFEDHVDRLNKLRMNHRFSSFSTALRVALLAELSSEPIVPQRDVLEAYLLANDPGTSEAVEALGDIPVPTPSSTALALQYLHAMRGRSTVLDSLGIEATAHFADIAAATMNYGIGDSAEAIRCAAPLLRAPAYFRRLGVRVASKALLRLDKWGEANDLIVGEALLDIRSIRMLPLPEAARQLKDKTVRRTLASRLSTPILLDLYGRHVDDNMRKPRQYSYDEFLRAHGLQKPHEIEPLTNQFDSESLKYYLRYVCIPQNMEASPAFSGTKDIEDERIQLCLILASIDSSNREIYIGEAISIARDQTIREAMLQAEQSKIYVDESGLRAWAERELLESFSRYKALRRITLTKSQETALSELRDELLRKKPEVHSGNAFQVPVHESVAILRDMATEIARAALTSAEFGLDSYLGTRIRHGTLSGQLRSALVEYNLITQKRATNMPYSNNEYWWNLFFGLPWHVRENVMQRLNSFSSQFDDLVDNFIKEQIQIVGPEKPAGLFASTMSSEALARITQRVGADTPFDEFVELCLQTVLQEAEASLERVRGVIAEEIKPRVSALLASLEEDVASDLDGSEAASGRGHFEWAVRTARTETMQLLDRVRGWFHLTRSTAEPTLSLDQLIDTSVRTVETLHRDFKPQVSKNVPDIYFDGALTRFTDIFYQLLENVWQHSRFQGNPKVVFNGSYDRGRLKLRMESDVDASVRTAKVEAELAAIRSEIAGSGYQHATRTEGRTGLKKLFRSISQGQSTRPALDFGFVGTRAFFVEFTFEIALSEANADVKDSHS